jgi:hypothetical protein
MRLAKSAFLAVALFAAACGGSSKDESTTPAANPCAPADGAANPCAPADGAANPCAPADGTAAPADGTEAPANPCGG